MKIKVIVITLMIMCMFAVISQCFATTNLGFEDETSTGLIDIKNQEFDRLKTYQEEYGDDTYGLAAYILRGIQIYSIPFGIIGIAVSSLYRYIIGVRRLDINYRGFGAMIGIVTVIIICQILPLVFALVVKGWRG